MVTARRAVFAFAVFFALFVPVPAAPGSRATTVILVRHAEKAAEPKDDPPLTEAGRARAEALARAVSTAGVTAVITSQFARTRETGAVAAGRLGLTPVPITVSVDPQTKLPTREATKALLDEIDKHAGSTVLVVAHSNTIPTIVESLGGPAGIVVEETRFDDLFVVTVTSRGHAVLTRLKYGA